jgi:signal peptidase I
MYQEEKPQNSYEVFSRFFGSVSTFIFNTIEAIVIALALSIILYLFVATPHEVVGRSMYPNFQNGEYLIGNKVTYRFSNPQRGDVIIYEYDETVDYIKRVIGLPGEEISLKNGRVFINDKALDETPYLNDSIYTEGGDFLQEQGSFRIPDEHYFTMGDNRSGSYDSREFGTIAREKVKGKVFIVYFPFSNFRLITHPEIDFHKN